MNRIIKDVIMGSIALAVAASAQAQTASSPIAPGPATPVVKIWNPPAYTTLAQSLVDTLWTEHKAEMAGISFHAIPPGTSKYAMIAATWLDRVGKASAEDDIMAAEEGFIILDPRYKKPDPDPKYLVIIPIKDRSGTNIGAAVFGFKNPANSGKSGPDYLAVATFMRDQIQKHIPDAAALYGKAR